MTLLDVLKQLHERMQNPENWILSGICIAVRDQLRTDEQIDIWYDDWRMRDHMYRLFHAWPKYSGEHSFPLPGGSEAYDIWNLSFGHSTDQKVRMWDREKSPYAALRWELLEWCIAELEKEQCTVGQNS